MISKLKSRSKMVMTITCKEAEFSISRRKPKTHLQLHQRTPINSLEKWLLLELAQRKYTMGWSIMWRQKVSSHKARMNTQMPTRKCSPGQDWKSLKSKKIIIALDYNPKNKVNIQKSILINYYGEINGEEGITLPHQRSPINKYRNEENRKLLLEYTSNKTRPIDRC